VLILGPSLEAETPAIADAVGALIADNGTHSSPPTPTVSAFANSGGAWILIGVRDDDSICGFDVPGLRCP
jgi:hypothetical protein